MEKKKDNFFLRLKRAIYGKKTVSECIVYTIVFLLFTAIALSYLFVVVWSLLAGMRGHRAVVLTPFENMLSNLQPKELLAVFTELKVAKWGFMEMFGMSVYFSIFGTFLTIMSTSTLAYVTTKYKFPCSNWFYFVVLFTMTLPLYGSGGAKYRLYQDLGFINNPAIIITCLGGMGGNFLYFNAFYRGLSSTFMEAAELDGANEWQIFFQIVFPQSMGITGALFLTMWVGQWNGYGDILIYLPKMPTLAAGLFLFNADMIYNARMDILFGACFITSIPPIVLFALFSKVLTNNVSLGGIKE
jgi:ABC-type glycerol-3-phosphate transport system permease component